VTRVVATVDKCGRDGQYHDATAAAADVASTGLRRRPRRGVQHHPFPVRDRPMALRPATNICRSVLMVLVVGVLQLVVVAVADLPRVLSQPGRRFLPRGMPARLDCPADANPPVTAVRWTKNGRPLEVPADAPPPTATAGSPWRLRVTERGALVFRSVTQEDAGRYSCTPYSQLGEGRSSVPVQLIVKGLCPSVFSVYMCKK